MLEPYGPEYAEIARETGAIGSSIVLVELGPRDNVLSAGVVMSAGNAALDQAAVRAALGSRYETAACGPHTAESSYRFVVEFTGSITRVIVNGVPWIGPYRNARMR